MRHLLSRGPAQSCGPQSQCIASDLGAQPRRFCRVSSQAPAPAITRSSGQDGTVGRRSNRGGRNGVAPGCAPAEKRRASCQKLAKRTTENHGVNPSAAEVAPAGSKQSRHGMTDPPAGRAVFWTLDWPCSSVSVSGVITGNWKPRRDSNPRARFRKRYIVGLDDTGQHQVSAFLQSRSRFLVTPVRVVRARPPCFWQVFHVQVAKNLPK